MDDLIVRVITTIIYGLLLALTLPTLRRYFKRFREESLELQRRLEERGLIIFDAWRTMYYVPEAADISFREQVRRATLMVKDLIKKLADSARKTIFICSHILPIVEELCDRIGIINQGRLVAVGTIEEIISHTRTKTLEEAFIAITGGVEEKELLAWREQKGAGA